MSALTELGVADLRDGLRRKRFSAGEVARAHLEAMEARRDLNLFLTETPDLALAAAAESDARLARGEGGALEGVPLAIKDLFCTDGVRTTAGSNILANFVPPYESTVTARLRAAGAVPLGKTNLDEFAMGSANVTSAFGPCRNPWQRSDGAYLVPGGSSGGSAGAVAARLAPAATGTDTGGSIRQPASFCGIVGVKPTYGRCSRFGIVAFASSLDQAGMFARSVRDCAVALMPAMGHDPRDSTSADLPVPDLETEVARENIRGLRVGIPQEYTVPGMPAEIAALWERGKGWLEAQGATTVPIRLPHTDYALPTYYIIAPAECSSNLARYDGVRYGLRVPGKDLLQTYEETRAAGFGAEVKRRIMIGTYVLSSGYYDAYYVKAQKVRTLIARDFQAAFETVDVILTPTAPSTAFALGEKMDDPIAMYLNDVFTVPASLAGLPGISVPAGLGSDGLPLGLQLIARPFDEATLFRAAGALERAAGFTARP